MILRPAQTCALTSWLSERDQQALRLSTNSAGKVLRSAYWNPADIPKKPIRKASTKDTPSGRSSSSMRAVIAFSADRLRAGEGAALLWTRSTSRLETGFHIRDGQ